MRLSLVATLILLAGCKRAPVDTDPDTDPGTEVDTDPDTELDTGDTGDTEVDSGDTDTDPVSTWVTLPEHCIPSGAGDDPITLRGEIVRTQTSPGGYFMELIDLERDGDTIYGVGQGGLLVFDISDPANPEELGHFPERDGRYHRVEPIDTTHVALTHRTRGLSIVDVSDPAAMLERYFQPEDGWEGLAVDGDYLLVTESDFGLIVLDVSEPQLPTEVTVEAGLSAPWELSRVVDGWVYVADNTLGVVPIDVADPEAPVIHAGIELDGATVLHVTATADHLFVAAGGRGVVVLDRSVDPSAPALVTTLKTYGSAVMTSVAGDLLYVADHDGLSVFDVSDPEHPAWVGRQASPQFGLAVVEQGDRRAWLGDWNHLEAWDVDPGTGAGQLQLAQRRIGLPEEGGDLDVAIVNVGSGDLVLTGATVDSDLVAVAVSSDTIAPGQTGTLRLTYTPAAETLSARLCLASNDPDQPRASVVLTRGIAPPPIGDPAPDFSLPGLDGETYRLSEQLGSPVLLAYFATW